jgi:hypothetical protein
MPVASNRDFPKQACPARPLLTAGRHTLGACASAAVRLDVAAARAQAPHIYEPLGAARYIRRVESAGTLLSSRLDVSFDHRRYRCSRMPTRGNLFLPALQEAERERWTDTWNGRIWLSES